ncbi:M1 family metallopeptidase [Psychrosphaera haliotis]|uniref:M1 family metallopeptidase n=1 Tax=Psychrosphaera haliotis TaxID=555083 RepID=UPI00236A3DB5|nr:M1 family metallopeptidase [Psychrosphaera haliotis]
MRLSALKNKLISDKTLVSIALVTALSACSSTGDKLVDNVANSDMANVDASQQLTSSDYSKKSGGVAPIRQHGLIMQYADLHFTVLPDTKSLVVKSKLKLTSAKPTTAVSVDLDRVFQIDRVMVNGSVLPVSNYSNPNGELQLDLLSEVSGEFEVQIDYQGKPREAIRAPWDGGFDWKKTKSGEHWIATAVQGEGCDLFWPCIDQPYGEVQNMDIKITVPDNLVAASNGVLMNVSCNNGQKTFHWQTSSLHNTYAIALNIGPYDVLESTYKSVFGNDIPVSFYHLKENTEKSKVLFEEIPPMLDFFETVIGPYPFGNEKMGVAETPHLGMEHQTINAYGNNYRKDEFGYDWLLHHEFAHEWFGNQLTNNNWDHMWLHEGFGSYMQPLYTQYLHGDMAYKAHLFKQRIGLINKFPIVSNKPLAVEEVYNRKVGPGNDIYAKGSLILHSLRELIGDEAFFDATRQLVYGTTKPIPGNFAPRFSDTNEFISIVNNITGKNLQWFFDVYIYQAKLPELTMDRTEQSLTLRWEIENNRPFPIPLDVSINGKVRTLILDEPKTIEVGRKDVVIVDPLSKVLRHQENIERYKAYLKAQREMKMAEFNKEIKKAEK